VIVFMDIDRTIADAKKRFKKAGPEPKSRGKKWGKWLRAIQNKKTLLKDEPVPGMALLCWAIHNANNLVYLTGRSEIYRSVTERWLHENGFPVGALVLMRPKQNRDMNGALKQRIIEKHLLRLRYTCTESVIVIDDDQNGDIEDMCHRNGYTFLKARSG
jgi:hypothetical protein